MSQENFSWYDPFKCSSLDQAEQQMFKTKSNRAQIIDFIEANILYLLAAL